MQTECSNLSHSASMRANAVKQEGAGPVTDNTKLKDDCEGLAKSVRERAIRDNIPVARRRARCYFGHIKQIGLSGKRSCGGVCTLSSDA